MNRFICRYMYVYHEGDGAAKHGDEDILHRPAHGPFGCCPRIHNLMVEANLANLEVTLLCQSPHILASPLGFSLHIHNLIVEANLEQWEVTLLPRLSKSPHILASAAHGPLGGCPDIQNLRSNFQQIQSKHHVLFLDFSPEI